MIITSKANELIKRVVSLNEKKFRKLYGEYLVEGIKPVNECISSGQKITNIFCTRDLESDYENPIVVSDELFSRISSEKCPQGVLATVKIPENTLIAPKGNCLLLDRLQDPGNLGTILRTANAAGYEDVYLINCTDAYSPKAVRASMSGVFFVRIHEGSLEEILSAIGKVPLICADMRGENVFEFKAPKKYCLCIGNEGGGLSEELKQIATHTVKIPMRPSCESLNAAISAAVSMYVLNNNHK